MINKNKLNTEEEMRDDFLKHFKQYKVFQQKSFYFDGGADVYYQGLNKKRVHTLELQKKYCDFLEQTLIDREKSIAIISLGAGNSEKEKVFLDQMHKDGYKFKYVGIDSSRDMIDMSQHILADVPYDVTLLHADFSNESVIEKVRELTSSYDQRLYAFIGGTLGNVEQDYIADILFDMLVPGDKLWVEVGIRPEKTDKQDRLLFERYLGYLDFRKDFYFLPLATLGVPPENGEMFLQMINEESLGSLKFTFRFRFTEKTVIKYKKRTITLLPGSTVDLISIRSYDPEGLAHFFEERHFRFLGKDSGEHMGQFLFEKK